MFACNIAVEIFGGGDSEFGWGKWVGRVVLGRQIGQLGSGRNPVKYKQFSGAEDIFFLLL